MIEPDRTWSNLIERDQTWSNVIELDWTWSNVMEHDQTWSNVIKHDRMWLNVNKCDQTWMNLIELEQTWWNLFEFIWNLNEYDQVKTSTIQFDYVHCSFKFNMNWIRFNLIIFWVSQFSRNIRSKRWNLIFWLERQINSRVWLTHHLVWQSNITASTLAG